MQKCTEINYFKSVLRICVLFSKYSNLIGNNFTCNYEIFISVNNYKKHTHFLTNIKLKKTIKVNIKKNQIKVI